MSIETINGISFGGGDLNPPKKAESTQSADTDSSDAVLRAEYESVIVKSLESEELDSTAVDDAKKALLDGSLDSPEAAGAAAESILEFGI